LETSSRGFTYGLDEQALPDPELNAGIIRTQLEMSESTERVRRMHRGEREKTDAIDAKVDRLEQRLCVAGIAPLDDEQH
jgi:hypothetical protein